MIKLPAVVNFDKCDTPHFARLFDVVFVDGVLKYHPGWTIEAGKLSVDTKNAGIEDPITYFANICADKRLDVELLYMLPRVAAHLFDPAPNSALFDSVSLRFRLGQLYRVTFIPMIVERVSDIYIASYARDATVAAHEMLMQRADGRYTIAVFIKGPPKSGPDQIDTPHCLETLGSMVERANGVVGRSNHFYHFRATRLTSRDGVPDHLGSEIKGATHMILFDTGGPHAQFATRELYDRLASFINGKLLAAIKLPVPHVEMSVNRDGMYFEVTPSKYAHLAWPAGRHIVIDATLALSSLELPVYVIVWILQKTPKLAMIREFRLVETVTRVHRSIRAIHNTKQ